MFETIKPVPYPHFACERAKIGDEEPIPLQYSGISKAESWWKSWNLKSKPVRKVVQTCPLVLKLCEVALPTSFTTSENFIKKYLFLVKLWTIFDFTSITLLVCFDFPKEISIFTLFLKGILNFRKKTFFQTKKFSRKKNFF